MEWYLKVVRDNFANFNGRARRKEYWMFLLFNLVVSGILSIVDQLFGMTLESGAGILGAVYSLAVLIPAIAASIRRLHDVGKSGWFLLLAFVPCVGGIYLLYLMIQDGEPGVNAYGPNPKDLDNTNSFGNFPPTPGSNPFTNPNS